ncbi:MAG: hypothetical protein LBI17_00670, partial [Rickettsiales bacterium]|nr:hypothetical protein [Rickettsiales bacterium]
MKKIAAILLLLAAASAGDASARPASRASKRVVRNSSLAQPVVEDTKKEDDAAAAKIAALEAELKIKELEAQLKEKESATAAPASAPLTGEAKLTVTALRANLASWQEINSQLEKDNKAKSDMLDSGGDFDSTFAVQTQKLNEIVSWRQGLKSGCAGINKKDLDSAKMAFTVSFFSSLAGTLGSAAQIVGVFGATDKPKESVTAAEQFEKNKNFNTVALVGS